ncbi:unnamed protein product [Brassica oleracea var. botrytis]
MRVDRRPYQVAEIMEFVLLGLMMSIHINDVAYM